MPDQRVDVQSSMADFQANAARLMGYAQHAYELYRRGDTAGAAMTIALTHYDISYLDDGRQNLLHVLEERHGVTPRDAIRRMCDEEAGRQPDAWLEGSP
jgi:hypothetical protein